MLKYLLILFVLVLAIVPLTHFAPSKRQKLVARMRELAAVSGLFVEFRKLPEALRGTRESPRDLIYYGKRFPAAMADKVVSGTWVRSADIWRSNGGARAIPRPLAELPDFVLAASVDGNSCGLYWVESSHEEDAKIVVDKVLAWADEIALQAGVTKSP